MMEVPDCGIQYDASSGGKVCGFVGDRYYSLLHPAGDKENHGDKQRWAIDPLCFHVYL